MSGTAHIGAAKSDFAPFVLLPGDPLRAEFIAKTFFDNARKVTRVRGMLGFTGQFEGRDISVMGSGMGMPSASIYCHELISEYGVTDIVRIGSCGTTVPDVSLMDIIIAVGACTDSNINRAMFGGHDYAATANFDLLRAAVDSATAQGHHVKVGNVFSSDLFYAPNPAYYEHLNQFRVLGIDMEAAALYSKAAQLGVRSLAMMTVSDHLTEGTALSSEERQHSFEAMIKLALATFSAST